MFNAIQSLSDKLIRRRRRRRNNEKPRVLRISTENILGNTYIFIFIHR